MRYGMTTVSSRRLFIAIIFLSTLVPITAFSQVTIKEKVEIKPDPAFRINKTAAASELRVLSEFGGPVDPNYAALVWVRGPCGINSSVAGASGSLTVPAYEGVYTVGYRFTSQNGGPFHFAVYLGNTALIDNHDPVSCPNGCTMFTQTDIPLYKSFTFSPAADPIGIGGTNYFTATIDPANTQCAQAAWSSWMDINLEITKGQNIGEFLGRDGQPVGTKTTMKADDPWYTPIFVADGSNAYGDVEITATSGDVSMIRTFAVRPAAPWVVIEPPWITYWPITVDFAHLPILDFGEYHYPFPGEPYEPTITWDPGSSIKTADYLDRIADTLHFFVKVKAENAGGVGVDSSEVILVRACLKVLFDPATLSPGDTASLRFQRVLPDGSVEDLGAGSYLFSATIMGGEDSSKGLLLGGYGEGTTLIDESAIRYIAPRTIQGSRLEVQVAGSAVASGGGDASVRVPGKLTPNSQLMNAMLAKKGISKSVTPKTLAATRKPGPTQLTEVMKKAVLMSSSCPINKVVVEQGRFSGFKISLSRDSLKNRDIAVDTVIAIDKDSNEVQIDAETAVNLSFEELGQLVDFISATGDTVDALNYVPYRVLRAGQVKVVARGTQTGPILAALQPKPKVRIGDALYQGERSDFPQAKIKVVMATDATKVALRSIALKPEIKVIVVADSIKPNYPTQTNLIPAAESQTAVKVAVTVSGILYCLPVPYGVTISSLGVEGSGGHSHTANRPTGRFIENGEQLTLQRQTGNDTIRTTYQASLFGGKEKIIATILNITPAIADTDSVIVRVPNLVLLPQGEHYVPVGGTCEHHGPRGEGDLDPCASPDNNHFVRRGVVDVLTAIAEAWFELDGHVLYINDISLPNGGGFDVGGGWQADICPNCFGHETHRIGNDIDIRTAFPNVRLGIWIRDEQGDLYVDERGRARGNPEFNSICNDRAIGHQIHGRLRTTNEHYHLQFALN
jgi:hypothetical protein